MCLLIDICAFSDFFNDNSYTIAKESLLKPKGPTITYGGSKYKKELGEKRIRFLSEFNNQKEIILLDDSDVDNLTQDLSDQTTKNFDDPHLMAILLLSNCKILISKDKRAKEGIRICFSGKKVKPIIYTSDKVGKTRLYDRRYRVT